MTFTLDELIKLANAMHLTLDFGIDEFEMRFTDASKIRVYHTFVKAEPTLGDLPRGQLWKRKIS